MKIGISCKSKVQLLAFGILVQAQACREVCSNQKMFVSDVDKEYRRYDEQWYQRCRHWGRFQSHETEHWGKFFKVSKNSVKNMQLEESTRVTQLRRSHSVYIPDNSAISKHIVKISMKCFHSLPPESFGRNK
jgi:hypothetical protein